MNLKLARIVCSILGHDRVFISDEEAEAGGWITGAYRPYNCLRCDYKAERRKWPRANHPPPQTRKDLL